MVLQLMQMIILLWLILGIIAYKYLTKMEAGKSIGKRGSGGIEFICSWGVVVCKTDDGRIFVRDENKHRIQVFSSDGKFLFKFGSQESENGYIQYRVGLTLSNCGQYLFVCDCSNYRIQLFNALNSGFVKSYGSKDSGDGQFEYPSRIWDSSSGRIIVCEYGYNN
jgi:DNA-binding beta-propeller fold protein YncE